MADDLLLTKLYVPLLRPSLVPRPHLIEKLNQGLQLGCKLTLISAPAGFGKTTLMTEWLKQLPADTCSFLSLDENDNDPTRFLTYLVASLRTVQTETATATGFGGTALALLQSPQSPPIESILAALINEIAATPHRFVMVLDDYHVIQSQAIHEILTFLLDHLPPQLHLVITSRTDPPLPLPRLRIRRELTELRVADLRFTPGEIALLFNNVLGLGLSTADIAALDARTEGWIAGLQVAAISMRGSENVSSFIRAFSGSHRYIMDYLVEEVLSQQPENIRNFLLHTAVLDDLTGPLCDAVTDQNGSREILEELERANLFIVPLDDERRWYRYHHLFADLLRVRLEQSLPGQRPEFHRRASTWYEKNGRLIEAVKHGLAAGDYMWSAYLIEKLADLLWARGEPTTLLRWLESFPDEQVFSRPCLCTHHAWALFISGQNEAAESRLQAAERALDGHSDVSEVDSTANPAGLNEAEKSEQRGRIAAIRASIAFRLGDGLGVFRYSGQAFGHLSETSHMWRCVTSIALGYAQDFSGDTEAAYQTLTEAVSMGRASGNIYLILSSGLHLGTILMLKGQLKQAYALGQELLQLAQERGVLHTEMAGCLYDELGFVLCEWNELEESMGHLSEGAKLSRQGYDVGVLGYSFLTMLRALLAQRDAVGMQGIIQEMEKMERDANVPPWYTSPKEAWRARVWLMQGDIAAATAWVDDRGLGVDGDLPYSREEEYIVLARIFVAQHRAGEAVELLERLLKQAESGGRNERMIQALIIQAMAFKAMNEDENALAALERCIVLAEPGGYLRLFLDEGPTMAALLRQALSRGSAPTYVGKLLAAFAVEGQQSGQSSDGGASQLVDPLSERELTVLRFLAAGLSNREIAEELYVTINTVKAHAKNIYSKLGVHGRMHAADRAKQLDLL